MRTGNLLRISDTNLVGSCFLCCFVFWCGELGRVVLGFFDGLNIDSGGLGLISCLDWLH